LAITDCVEGGSVRAGVAPKQCGERSRSPDGAHDSLASMHRGSFASSLLSTAPCCGIRTSRRFGALHLMDVRL